MIQKVEFEPAIILHRKPYKETSLLVDLLTLNYGRIALVANGARKSRDKAGLLQPFQMLSVSWKSRSDLGTLTQVELMSALVEDGDLGMDFPWVKRLQGSRLYCGLYLNELIIRCIQRVQAIDGLFQLYCHSLELLQSDIEEAVVLRSFEWQLIRLLGYGVSLNQTRNGIDIEPDKYYYYHVGHGIDETTSSSPQAVSGAALLEFHCGQWHKAEFAKDARQLTWQALQPFIGDKPFASRRLYQGLLQQQKSIKIF